MAIRNVSPTEVYLSGATGLFQYQFVKLSTAGAMIKTTTADNSINTSVPVYVVQNAPTAGISSEPLEVAGVTGYNTYVHVATTGTATVERNTPLTCDGGGYAIVATAGKQIYAYTLDVYSSSGTLVPVKLANTNFPIVYTT
jgi:hypothetical protein